MAPAHSIYILVVEAHLIKNNKAGRLLVSLRKHSEGEQHASSRAQNKGSLSDQQIREDTGEEITLELMNKRQQGRDSQAKEMTCISPCVTHCRPGG